MEKEESIDNNKCNDAPPLACGLTNNPDIQNIEQNNDNNYNIVNIDKVEPNKHEININISEVLLKALSKDYLIDLILFLKNCCQMTIEEKEAIFNHEIFKIEKDIKNINEYLIIIKDFEYKKDNNQKKDNINIKNYFNFKEEKNNDIINQIIKNEKENSMDEIDHINKYYLKKKNKFSKKIKPYYCLEHNRRFRTEQDYAHHINDSHKFKCKECNTLFKTEDLLNKHICNNKNNENYINNIDENNKNDEYDKIKKVENDSINFFEEEEDYKKPNEDEINQKIEKLKKYLPEQNKKKEISLNEALKMMKTEKKLMKKISKEQARINNEKKRNEKIKKKKEKNIKKKKEYELKKREVLDIKDYIKEKQEEKKKEIENKNKEEKNNNIK